VARCCVNIGARSGLLCLEAQHVQEVDHAKAGLLSVVNEAAFRAIIHLFCDLQSARHWLFRPLAQVIHPPKFIFESGETTRKTP
jgi:hypothetical protein